MNPSHNRTARRWTRGITLLELLIASALVAVIFVALAQTTHLFAEQIAYASDEADDELERASQVMTDAIRQAWIVEKPTNTSFETYDALGRVTKFFLEGDELKLTRPSGATGTLLEDIASFDINTSTIPRYREAAELSASDTWWTTSGSGAMSGVLLQPGEAIGVGFFASSEAPDSVNRVEGVVERRISTTIDQLSLIIDKIDLADHVFWHLYDDPPNGSTPIGDLKATLYESRGPGSAIPYGPAITELVASLDTLPTNGYYWIEESSGEVIVPPNGAAYGWWKNHPDVGLVVTIPTAGFGLDLSAMSADIEPGRAYVLTLETEGYGAVALFTRNGSSSTDSLSYSPNLSTMSLAEQAITVPFSISGTNVYTQTTAHDVVEQVSVSFQRSDGGRSHAASASVSSHTGVDDPWLGAVPGELPTLEMP